MCLVIFVALEVENDCFVVCLVRNVLVVNKATSYTSPFC